MKMPAVYLAAINKPLNLIAWKDSLFLLVFVRYLPSSAHKETTTPFAHAYRALGYWEQIAARYR